MSGESALASLRHLYAQLIQGAVSPQPSAARGLLGPAIEALEGVASRLAAAEARAVEAERERDEARAILDAKSQTRSERAIAVLHDRALAAEAEVKRYREVVEEIAGVGHCVACVGESPCLGSNKPRDEWCWVCIARAALAAKGDGR